MKPTVPSNLIIPCSDLLELKGTKGKDVTIWALDTVKRYADCKDKHQALVEIVK